MTDRRQRQPASDEAPHAILLQSEVGLAQCFQVVDVVKKRREPQLLILTCCLTYPLQRTERVFPARCPGRVLLGQVPFGRRVKWWRISGLRMMPPFPPPPLSFRTAGFPQYAGRLACQLVPSLMSLRLSQHQACPAQHVGLHLPFVHSAVSLRIPHCVGTVSPVVHRHARRYLLYPRGPRSGLGSIVPVHPRLIGLIRPTRRHIPTSPQGGLYGMPSLCWCA
jgi:hypothetical protein